MENLNTTCQSCGSSTRDLRLGHCWECATVESIIADGVDMYEKGIDGSDTPCKTAMDKVILLHQKGLLKK